MKVLFGGLFSAFLVGVCFFSFAQTKLSAIQGKVLMENNEAAEAATVVLLKAADSSVVRSGLVDAAGKFEFTSVAPGAYLLLATSMGCNKVYSNPYKTSEGQTLVAGNIVLKRVNNQLQEVKVVAKRPYIEVKPGKIVLNVQNSLTAEGNSAYDILRQSPGVHVNSTNETLMISGRQPALITIDGKPTNLTGDDLVNLLRSLQSSTIDQIEMITSASAKYDASGGGIINIISKKGTNVGTNGTVTLGGGYGKYYKSRAGITFNNRTAKLNIFGNYTFDDNKTNRYINTNRNIIYKDVLSNYDVDYNNIQKTYNHNFKLGADYAISPKQTIGVLVTGVVREDDFLKNNNLNISNQNRLDSVIIAKSTLDRGSSFLNYNINYNGTLDKSGKNLSADVNYSTYHRHSNEYITNNFYIPTGVKYRDSLQLENLSPSDIHIWTTKIDYVNPLSKTSKLEAGVKYNYIQSDNNLVFGPLINNTYRADPDYTNRFIYTEIVSAAYLNYVNKIGQFNITAGLRAEKTNTTGSSIGVDQSSQVSNKNNYFNLFPQVQLNYEVDKKNVLNLSYNRGIHRPDYQDINPFLYYTDLYDYNSGNPNLKPEYTNSIQLSHTYNNTFITTLYYNVTNDAYDFPVYEQNDSSKVNITIRRNFGRIFVYGATFFAPVQFNNWWNAGFNLDASYQRYTSYAIYGNFSRGMQDIIFNTTQNFTLSSTIAAELSGMYETPTLYGINELKQRYTVNAGIGKQIFNKRGNLKLSVIDIFNSDRYRYHVGYQNIDFTGIDKRETRRVMINFTYRFGKTSVKSASKHSTGNDDEQRRTGNRN
ncbi:outer membrane beta-barrel family protein [Mucilaginibacter lappiensis]|uniref:Outer membrane receptor protein involved in Fe transport n=1 Tax=Mucilaginibacter lappiensis TaxID=354630 RepID=A0A841JJF9_9SPHI|nr:outer membrane beta-barrel family protein [Mucilaginibacter lappiensis]MBB6128111.1 outer membrane receptor protein involved in Fe transport [Mucilaginibacter lappiensis]